MQIRIFTIPLLHNEPFVEEMNHFLRSKKVLDIREEFYVSGYWSFVIRYTDDVNAVDRERSNVDYRKLLDDAAFERFSQYRKIRKEAADADAVPPFAVFTDYELSEIAKLLPLTLDGMKGINGIGDKKIEKYGKLFLPNVDQKKS
jgi:superfamily II DNA helicase RecQ